MSGKEMIMIKLVTMYSVVCDRCGKSFIDEFNGIVAWLDEGTAKEQAMESEWVEICNKHYCPDCYAVSYTHLTLPTNNRV